MSGKPGLLGHQFVYQTAHEHFSLDTHIVGKHAVEMLLLW
jgi:hypothetical protein